MIITDTTILILLCNSSMIFLFDYVYRQIILMMINIYNWFYVFYVVAFFLCFFLKLNKKKLLYFVPDQIENNFVHCPKKQ